MKIFQIITLSELGGAQSVLVNLSNTLIKEHYVVVIAGENDGKMFQLLDKKIKQIKIKSLCRNIAPLNDLLTIIRFFKLYIQYKPDIIHLHSSKAGILGRLVFPKNKVIYTEHGFDSKRLDNRKYLLLEKIFQNRCKAIVGVSMYDETNLRSEGITHNIMYVHNGIKRPAICKNINLDIPTKYIKKILCIARISKQKRFDIFLKVASFLPDYAFIWIGNKKKMENIPENVFCLGNIVNAGTYNQIIDLFILPSNWEGLPIVILEAMSFGKPIVASNVGGISEIVIDNENGYTVDNDATIFADKIKYILENEDIYKKFSENALYQFNKDLTVDKMVKAYMKVYQS